MRTSLRDADRYATIRRVRQRLQWLVLLAMIGVTAYGVAASQVRTEDYWTPEGLTRWKSYIAAFASLSTIAILAMPRLVTALLLSIAAAWTIAAVGVVPLVVIALVTLAAWCLGSFCVRPREAIEHVLSLVLGLGCFSLLQGLLVHFPINYPLTTILLCLAAIVGGRNQLAPLRLLARKATARNRGTQASLALMGFPLLAHWLVALKPEVSVDGLGMHLAIPYMVKDLHRWPFDFQSLLWSVMPMGGDWLFTFALLPGGEAAARLINVVLLTSIAGLVFLALRQVTTLIVSAALTALFLSTPLVHLVSGSLFVENFWSAMIVASFIALWRSRWMLAAVLAGIALSAKVGALAFILPLAVWACWKFPRKAWAFILLVAVFGATPYVTAYVKTGNPVFPFLNQVFASPYYHSDWTLRDVRFERPIRWNALYDLTFKTNEYLEAAPLAAGLQYLLLIPVALAALAARKDRLARAALLCGLGGAAAVLAQESNLRYCYAAMPLVTIGFAASLASLASLDRRLVLALCVPVLLFNMYVLPAAGPIHPDFWLNPLNPEAARSYVEEHAPVRHLVEQLNATAPGEPVIFVGTHGIAGLKGKGYSNTWHTKAVEERLLTAVSPLQVLELANDFGVRYFVAPAPGDSTIPILLPGFSPFLQAFTTEQSRSGHLHIAKLKPEFAGKEGLKRAAEVWDARQKAETTAIAPVKFLQAGTYDDMSPDFVYFGPWERSREYPLAHDGSLSYSNVIGSAVQFGFNGTHITLIYTRAFNHGKAGIRIDDGPEITLDAYTPQIAWQARRTFDDLPAGDHRVVVRVLPEKDPAAEGFFVSIDAIEVR